jgi:uncharacterized membrane protein YccC
MEFNMKKIAIHAIGVVFCVVIFYGLMAVLDFILMKNDLSFDLSSNVYSVLGGVVLLFAIFIQMLIHKQIKKFSKKNNSQ